MILTTRQLVLTTLKFRRIAVEIKMLKAPKRPFDVAHGGAARRPRRSASWNSPSTVGARLAVEIMPRPPTAPPEIDWFWWWGGTGLNILAGLHRLRQQLDIQGVQLTFVVTRKPGWGAADYPHLDKLLAEVSCHRAAPRAGLIDVGSAAVSSSVPIAYRLPDLDISAVALRWVAVEGQRKLLCPGGEASFWHQVNTLGATARWGTGTTWLVLPLLLEGQFPVRFSRAELGGAYGKTAHEIGECHINMLVVRLPSGRSDQRSNYHIERLDSYRADSDGSWAEAPGTKLSAAAECGRYEVDDLDVHLATLFAQHLGGDGEYHGCEICPADGCRGPQDWEEECEQQHQPPGGTDGLGFCLAWGMALTEFRCVRTASLLVTTFDGFHRPHAASGTRSFRRQPSSQRSTSTSCCLLAKLLRASPMLPKRGGCTIMGVISRGSLCATETMSYSAKRSRPGT
jgi:hypothetical protein